MATLGPCSIGDPRISLPDFGFAPPTCSASGAGGSVDSGPATNPGGSTATVVLLVISLIVVAPLAILCIALGIRKDGRDLMRQKANLLRYYGRSGLVGSAERRMEEQPKPGQPTQKFSPFYTIFFLPSAAQEEVNLLLVLVVVLAGIAFSFIGLVFKPHKMFS